jgi:nitrogen fixation-related uncharacterized protein
MIAVAVITAAVILAVAFVALGGRRFDDIEVLTEREAVDRLRPYSGAVESATQNAPIEGER